MKLVRLAVAQPITVTVGILLSLLAGVLALVRVPIQMTPTVDSVVLSITTTWEGSSAAEIETDVVEPQEEVLANLSGLVQMTSTSQAGQGNIRLEFDTGTDIAAALTEADQKLSEVPGYPEGVNQPTIVDADPESVDYISWIGLVTSDPEFDATTLQDFIDRRLVPRFERLPGVGEVGLIGTQERELQILVDPEKLAARGITYAELVRALREDNGNWSAGKLPEGKNDIRIRAVGRFDDEKAVEELVIRRDENGSVLVEDVASVSVGFKERTTWCRARGELVPFLNFQLEYGANLLEAMTAIDDELAALNGPGGLLELEAKRLGLNGNLQLVKSYDAAVYVREALGLVQSNIYIGGALAVLVLLLFLRSFFTVGIVAVAIPISVISAVVVLVAVGRSVNIVSLAGMAFAVGMVVDNAIVVIENIFRHLEMGKRVRQAAVDGTLEVGGAVLASTLTTIAVFVPVLLIQDAAGQLFRDIALAIVASVGLSLVVSVLVIPSAAAALIRDRPERERKDPKGLRTIPRRIAGVTTTLTKTRLRSAATVLLFAVMTPLGIWWLAPPLDYLPSGNRNISFGILFPPPAYNTEQLSEIGDRIEDRVRPFWEAAGDRYEIEAIRRGSDGPPADARHPIPMMNGDEMIQEIPAPLDQYFIVGFDGQVFHGAISDDPKRAVDAAALLNWSAGPGVAPDVFGFALQMPLFNTGGSTGSAIAIDMTARELGLIEPAAGALMGALMGHFGPFAVQPDPANFALPSPELRFLPDDERLREVGLSRQDLGFAVQANGDGLIVPRQYELDGELKDLKLIAPAAKGDDPVPALLATPIATPTGGVVDLGSVARVMRVTGPDRIKRVDRQRAITIEVTPQTGEPLDESLSVIRSTVDGLRAGGVLSPEVEVRLAGTAGKLNDIKSALLGDGSLIGLLSSSLFLALAVIYLLLVVLFQSWLLPVVILLTVPLATFGGFLGLKVVHEWSLVDRYMPIQNLDVLTILGFVILAGVVVNNAILIVHQALHFVRRDGMSVNAGIAESVRTRVRPIAMGTMTSVGGMLPLVLMPGSGSELYRGLGAVVVGGLVVSTVFTLLLVPVALALVLRPAARAT